MQRRRKPSGARRAAKIFICYRRDDSAAYAGRIHGDLRQRFKGHEVFMDLGIELGADFDEQIQSELSACAAVLVIIGPDWLRAADEHGGRRLDDPDDFVRREIALALERPEVVVIPLLVRRAPMPTERELPAPLAALARRRGLELRDDRWHDDIRLVEERLRDLSPLPPPLRPWATGPLEVGPVKPEDHRRQLRRLALGVLLIALVAVVAVIGASIIPSKPGTRRVRIGAIFALSGVAKDANDEVVRGARFAVEYINGMHDPGARLPLAAGRGLPHLSGAKLDLVVGDAGATRCTVEPAFDRLVDGAHVVGVVGANESTVTLRAIVAADRQRVPLVNAGSSATNLTKPSSSRSVRTCKDEQDDPRPSRWFFHIGPNDTQAAEQFFAFIDAPGQRSKLGPVGRVAILQESSDIFGNGGAAALRDVAKSHAIKARRFKYPSVLGTSINVTDKRCSAKEQGLIDSLGSLVKSVNSYKPDVLFAVSYLPDAITIIQEMSRLGYVPPAMLVSGSSFTSNEFIKGVRTGNPACKHPALPADPGGIVAQAAWASDVRHPTTTTQHIARLFEQRYGHPMSVRSAGGFTAVMTLAQAIDKARSRHPADIRNALSALDVPADRTIMPWDGIRFSTTGENNRSKIVLQQFLRGSYHVVYPGSRATERAILPLASARG